MRASGEGCLSRFIFYAVKMFGLKPINLLAFNFIFIFTSTECFTISSRSSGSTPIRSSCGLLGCGCDHVHTVSVQKLLLKSDVLLKNLQCNKFIHKNDLISQNHVHYVNVITPFFPAFCVFAAYRVILLFMMKLKRKTQIYIIASSSVALLLGTSSLTLLTGMIFPLQVFSLTTRWH